MRGKGKEPERERVWSSREAGGKEGGKEERLQEGGELRREGENRIVCRATPYHFSKEMKTDNDLYTLYVPKGMKN